MDIERYRGDTAADSILVVNETTGTPANLTGSTLVMTLDSKRNPTDSSTQVYQLTGVSSSPISGVVEFSPSLVQSNLIGLYYYDIQLTDSNGLIRTISKGTYQYLQDITK